MANEMLDIQMEVNRNWKTVELEVEKGGKAYPPFAGPYEIDASFYFDTRLNTYGKSMTDDMVINRIPVIEASNPQGGKTITIGV